MKVDMNMHINEASYVVPEAAGDYAEIDTIASRADRIANITMSGSESDDKFLPLYKALEKLDPELRAVLEAKYGVNTEAEKNDSSVAEKLGTTPESVGALEEAALRSLFSPSTKIN